MDHDESSFQHFGDYLAELARDQMLDFSGHRFSPVTNARVPVSGGFDPANMFQVVGLDDYGWSTLHQSITFGVLHNTSPWKRCVAVLRHEGAQTCVIEQHYVCLDLRAEVSAFSSQLDAPAASTAIRLHFFREVILDGQVSHLSSAQQDSYLGYIVCRRPGSPPIGRTLIRTPEYITTSAQVVEHINFFGQSLEVKGVPFMQQDERYAVCAHTAAWTILYSAHRKNIIERKLISDVVSASSPNRSMHPVAPTALTVDAVQSTVQLLGLHFPVTSITEDDRIAFNVLLAEDYGLTKHQIARLSQFGKELAESIGYGVSDAELPDFSADHVKFISELWKRVTIAKEFGIDTSAQHDLETLAVQLVDYTVFSEMEHHVRSGFPVYCHTVDHAMTLCGYSGQGIDRMYYFHDDQYGPYLASDSIVAATKSQFRIQAHSSRNLVSQGSTSTPDTDYAAPENYQTSDGPANRGVIAIGLAGPARLLLTPSAALGSTKELLATAKSEWEELVELAQNFDDNDGATLVSDKLRTSILMGIDYKRERLKNVSPASTLALYIASMHLAEWVVVVEMMTDDDTQSLGDFVYDGTSSSQHPLLQSVLVAGHAIGRNPVDWPDIVEFDSSVDRFPALEIPFRVGKN